MTNARSWHFVLSTELKYIIQFLLHTLKKITKWLKNKMWEYTALCIYLAFGKEEAMNCFSRLSEPRPRKRWVVIVRSISSISILVVPEEFINRHTVYNATSNSGLVPINELPTGFTWSFHSNWIVIKCGFSLGFWKHFNCSLVSCSYVFKWTRIRAIWSPLEYYVHF